MHCRNNTALLILKSQKGSNITYTHMQAFDLSEKKWASFSFYDYRREYPADVTIENLGSRNDLVMLTYLRSEPVFLVYDYSTQTITRINVTPVP